MPRGRRGRPGLVGTMARTAVIAGTATAVVGHSQNKQAAKQQSAAEAQAAQQAAFDSQAQVADMQAQMDAMQAQTGRPAATARRRTCCGTGRFADGRARQARRPQGRRRAQR